VLALGFFNMAGIIGDGFIWMFTIAIGRAVYALPFVLILAGLMCFGAKKENFGGPLILSALLLVWGLAGILAVFNLETGQQGAGGRIGYYTALLLVNLFGKIVAGIFFSAAILIAGLVFWWMLGQPRPDLGKFAEKIIEN